MYGVYKKQIGRTRFYSSSSLSKNNMKKLKIKNNKNNGENLKRSLKCFVCTREYVPLMKNRFTDMCIGYKKLWENHNGSLISYINNRKDLIMKNKKPAKSKNIISMIKFTNMYYKW